MEADKILGKFNLNFAGQPSLFEGKSIVPAGSPDLKLQILAADQAGNFGQHFVSLCIHP